MSRPRTSSHVCEFLGISKKQLFNLGGIDFLCGLNAGEIFVLVNDIKRIQQGRREHSKAVSA